MFSIRSFGDRRFSRAWRGAVVATAAVLMIGCEASPMTPAEEEPPVGMASSSVLTGASLYVDGNSAARRQADAWKAERPSDAMQIEKIARAPQAVWLGEWSGDVRSAANAVVSEAAAAGQVAVLVAYNVPQRDCGGLSGGGGATAEAYRSWIAEMARGIGQREAAVILEPDALAALDCLSAVEQRQRMELLRDAASMLKRETRSAVYIDAGHARWHAADRIAERLQAAGIATADGFSLNVSNYLTDEENAAYGARVSALVGGKHFVIDSSRNGLGPAPDGEWCNPAGRALGRRPTTATGHALLDAFLWVKRPGESDGACNGGPAAGQWWADYALGLARRAAY
jgi:endoglucanase